MIEITPPSDDTNKMIKSSRIFDEEGRLIISLIIQVEFTSKIKLIKKNHLLDQKESNNEENREE